MKALITIILTAFVSLVYSQSYTHKIITLETQDSTGLHYSPEHWVPKSGTIRLTKYELILTDKDGAKRVYKLNFEPLLHYRGLYFNATFEGRVFECYYNLDCGWLLVKRHRYFTYYYFKKEL